MSVGEPGADGIHGHAFAGHFGGERAREADQRVFRGGIRGDVRRADEAGERGDVDHAPQRRSSIPQHGAGEQIRAGRVDAQVPLPQRGVILENGADSAMPALLTRTSTGPRLAAIEATPRTTAPSSVTSSTSGTVLTPRFATAAALAAT
jgi:hypothetical protein